MGTQTECDNLRHMYVATSQLYFDRCLFVITQNYGGLYEKIDFDQFFNSIVCNHNLILQLMAEVTFGWQDVYGAQTREGSFTSINNGISYNTIIDAT